MGWRVRAVSVASSGGAIPRGDDALDNNEKKRPRRWRYFHLARGVDARRDAPFAPRSARAAAWRRCVPTSRARGLESCVRGATRGCLNASDATSDRIVVANARYFAFHFGHSESRFMYANRIATRARRRPWNPGSRSRLPAIFAAVDALFFVRRIGAKTSRRAADRAALPPRSRRLARCPARPRKPKRRLASRCEAGRPG